MQIWCCHLLKIINRLVLYHGRLRSKRKQRNKIAFYLARKQQIFTTYNLRWFINININDRLLFILTEQDCH